jgi:hypothetical protein
MAGPDSEAPAPPLADATRYRVAVSPPFASVDGPAGQRANSTSGLKIESLTDGAALNESTRLAINSRQPRPSSTVEDPSIMSRRKPLAAFAVLTAALALAVPAGSASATTTPTAPVAFLGPPVHIDIPGSLPCQILYWQIPSRVAVGNTALANLFLNAFLYSGCGGAAV